MRQISLGVSSAVGWENAPVSDSKRHTESILEIDVFGRSIGGAVIHMLLLDVQPARTSFRPKSVEKCPSA